VPSWPCQHLLLLIAKHDMLAVYRPQIMFRPHRESDIALPPSEDGLSSEVRTTRRRGEETLWLAHLC